MKPAISITENNTIILDCLNEHHDHIEIDVNDVLFLTILKDLVHIAFLMDKQNINTGILESTGKFKKTNYELDDSKYVYFLNDLDWEWTVFKPIVHPLNLPNLGSTFKNPTGNFAAQLISDCGLKGYTVGGAQVSPVHPNFITNIWNAKFKDVLDVIEHVKKTVKENTGIQLETEIIILK